ncbi:MAG TPA: secretin N-terminal domain-containing protein, partial [Candidatus Binatia bacterium]|nr:secretin N-terminal domain-containing protein [Candidatus Binatia bacterium]
ERAAAARPAATAAPQAQQPQQRRITVHFQQTPILDVLATFAEFSGRSIVAGANVTGTVTADIRDQPWDVALDAILQSHGLAARESESGIIRVDAVDKVREREKVEDLVTRQYPIRYVPVDSLVNTVKGFLSDRGKVATNPAANALVITEARSVLERIEPTIAQLDVRRPQVTISAKIIFVDRTALEELGIVYDLKDAPHGNQLNQIAPGWVDKNGDGILDEDERVDEDVVLLRGNSIAALANAKLRPTAPALQVLTSLSLNRHTLINFIEALQQLQLSDIQASPVVTTMDNREARIQVGEETPIRVIDVGAGAQAGNVPPRATVQLKETGIILRVKPHVTGDQVLLDLHAERSNIAVAPSDIGVTFQTQESATQVLVRDGETVVIGGLTIVEKSKLRAGIPFLMDLPLVGALFRTTSERETKKDLLIMVTPHIVREAED